MKILPKAQPKKKEAAPKTISQNKKDFRVEGDYIVLSNPSSI